jgi:hypothetical protein
LASGGCCVPEDVALPRWLPLKSVFIISRMYVCLPVPTVTEALTA